MTLSDICHHRPPIQANVTNGAQMMCKFNDPIVMDVDDFQSIK